MRKRALSTSDRQKKKMSLDKKPSKKALRFCLIAIVFFVIGTGFLMLGVYIVKKHGKKLEKSTRRKAEEKTG